MLSCATCIKSISKAALRTWPESLDANVEPVDNRNIIEVCTVWNESELDGRGKLRSVPDHALKLKTDRVLLSRAVKHVLRHVAHLHSRRLVRRALALSVAES